jgi:hypothetical protein
MDVALYQHNQQLIKNALKNSFLILRTSYPSGNKIYSFAVKTADGYYVTDRAVHPWNYDSNKSNNFEPVLIDVAYRESSQYSYRDIPSKMKKQTTVYENTIYNIEDDLFDNGLQIYEGSEFKYAWIVLISSDKSLNRQPDAEISYTIYHQDMSSTAKNGLYEIKTLSTSGNIIGGICVIPTPLNPYPGIIDMQLAGIICERNGTWYLARLGGQNNVSGQTDSDSNSASQKNDNSTSDTNNYSDYNKYIYNIAVEKIELVLNGEKEENDSVKWSGTGFKLADGRFVTSRHIIEPWFYNNEKFFYNLNIFANNGGKIIVHFKASSNSGDSFRFTSEKAVCNRKQDKSTIIEEGGYRITYSPTDARANDWAYIDLGYKMGFTIDKTKSSSLSKGVNLYIIGYPNGWNSKAFSNTNPSTKELITEKEGLTDGVIKTTVSNFEQGYSGSPAIYKAADGSLFVVGIVSSGLSNVPGFIVPISSLF